MKGLSFVAGPARGSIDPAYDFTTFPEVVSSASDAYAQAGVNDPRAEIAMAEVHDCFTPTELVLMEDLGFAERGFGWKEVLAGTFDLDGELPVNPDGGLKAFGHPIGASGLRMMFECWLQLRREAPEVRQIKSLDHGRKLAITHNLGGQPGECVSFVSVVGIRTLRRRFSRISSGGDGELEIVCDEPPTRVDGENIVRCWPSPARGVWLQPCHRALPELGAGERPTA